MEKSVIGANDDWPCCKYAASPHAVVLLKLVVTTDPDLKVGDAKWTTGRGGGHAGIQLQTESEHQLLHTRTHTHSEYQ